MQSDYGIQQTQTAQGYLQGWSAHLSYFHVYSDLSLGQKEMDQGSRKP